MLLLTLVTIVTVGVSFSSKQKKERRSTLAIQTSIVLTDAGDDQWSAQYEKEKTPDRDEMGESI